jgi:uncharacterized protein
MSLEHPIEISPAQARRLLVSQAGLCRMDRPGRAAVPRLLAQRRCIQLDPLDRIGTNADLVAMARVPSLKKGEIYERLLPGHAFEHFAKERCLLPASAFPYYRDQAAETPWWRLNDRLKRLPASLVDEVLVEVAERGPVTAAELGDRGRVEAIDWNGWKGTGKAATMALEVLWLRSAVVVCGRRGRHKVYDIPGRALPTVADLQPAQPFARWALLERVEAAGLLATAGGPWWSMLGPVRTSQLPRQLLEEGVLECVRVSGSRRSYLAPAGILERPVPRHDGKLRILGPLDPLIWDRKLVQLAFGFDYVWEVYKPAAKRRWGYYVCPLLHRGRLVGRFEARMEGPRLVVDRLWPEEGRVLDEEALAQALARHEEALS